MLGQHRSTQRKVPRGADDEQALREDIIALAKQYGRYGYRRVTALLCHASWTVNHKRVERIWRREGLKVPQRQPKRGRLWLNDGSCIRLRPEYPGHVWAYDFVEGRTHDGRKFRILTIIDEAISGLRFRFAPPPSGYGGDELNELTNQSVHSVGADHADQSTSDWNGGKFFRADIIGVATVNEDAPLGLVVRITDIQNLRRVGTPPRLKTVSF